MEAIQELRSPEHLTYTSGFTGKTSMTFPLKGRISLPRQFLLWNGETIPEIGMTIIQQPTKPALFVFPQQLVTGNLRSNAEVIQHPIHFGTNRRLQLNPFRKALAIEDDQDATIVLRGRGPYFAITKPENENIKLDPHTLIDLIPPECALDMASASLASELMEVVELLRTLVERQIGLDALLDLTDTELSEKKIKLLIDQIRQMINRQKSITLEVDFNIAGTNVKGTLKIR